MSGVVDATGLPAPEDIALISQWMAAAQIASVEITGPDGARVLIVASGESIVAAGDPCGQPTDRPVVVSTSGFGLFMPEALEPGMSVQKGALLAMLTMEALCMPVLAPCDGVLIEQLVETGSLVGYGTTVFRLMPMAWAENVEYETEGFAPLNAKPLP